MYPHEDVVNRPTTLASALVAALGAFLLLWLPHLDEFQVEDFFKTQVYLCGSCVLAS